MIEVFLSEGRVLVAYCNLINCFFFFFSSRRRHTRCSRDWSSDVCSSDLPAIVVAGHKKPGAPDSPSTIQDTKRYLQDFDRLQKTATSDQELFDQMTELYPHWVANQSWLMFGFPQP